MASKHYHVTNAYVDRESGETVLPGEVVEIDDDRVEAFRKADVIGKEVEAQQGSKIPDEILSNLPNAEQFEGLSANEQKELLAKLPVEGDVGNAEKRLELYSEFLKQVGSKGE